MGTFFTLSGMSRAHAVGRTRSTSHCLPGSTSVRELNSRGHLAGKRVHDQAACGKHKHQVNMYERVGWHGYEVHTSIRSKRMSA